MHICIGTVFFGMVSVRRGDPMVFDEYYLLTYMFPHGLVGTRPNDDIYQAHIAQRQIDQAERDGDSYFLRNGQPIDELRATVDASKGTGFLREMGIPVLQNYMIRGHFKSAAGAIREFRTDSETWKIRRNYRRVITHNVHVDPTLIELEIPAPMRTYSRAIPLFRGTCIAHSELAPPNTRIHFGVALNSDIVSRDMLEEWLEHGITIGLGEHRSSQHYGVFEYEIEAVSDIEYTEVVIRMADRLSAARNYTPDPDSDVDVL